MNFISGFFYNYFSRRTLPYWIILLLDCIIVMLSMLMVQVLISGLIATLSVFWPLTATFAVYTICFLIGFRIFRTYKGIIRFSSFVDLQRVGCAGLFGMTLAILLNTLISSNTFLEPIRIRVIILGSTMAMLLMCGMRVLIKYLYDSVYRVPGADRIFIYGTRAGGVSIAKSIRNQNPATYILAGFLSDDVNTIGRVLMGVNVLRAGKNAVPLMTQAKVKAIFVSPLKTELFRNNSDFVNALIDAGIQIFMVPDAVKWDGKALLPHTQLREVDIESLLPREKIEVDMDSIARDIHGKAILITGAAGSIGSEIVRQVAIYGPRKLILIDQAETPLHDIRLLMKRDFPDIEAHTIVADISNPSRMAEIFQLHTPDYVYHAAAYKHVPMMEDNPSESVTNNIVGTRIVADLSVRHGVRKFVMVSTDKAVNPTNVMGCSKRICEIYVQSLDKAIKEHKIKGQTCFVTTRFGNVLGSNGSVIPLFREQIKRGGPITVTHPDIIRYFMLIPEACKLVLEAGTMGKGGEIFVFDMGKPVKILDLAKRMIRLSGVDIEIKFTGLRDGEKLYEEVLNERETTMATPHPKVKVARVREYDYSLVKTRVENLIRVTASESDMSIVREMKLLVPEFKSQNSKYESLDAEFRLSPSLSN